MESSIGSIWRKWDLHIHTPASLTWEQGKRFDQMTEAEADEACRAIIDRMNASDVAAFGIMDYWSFDGYLRLRMFLQANSDIQLRKAMFPGMELRCEAPTNLRMNIHVLLSDELSGQQLRDFKAALQIPLVGRALSDEAISEAATRMTGDKLRAVGHRQKDLEDAESRLEIGHKVALISRESLFGAFKAIPKGTGLLLLPFDTYHGLRDINWREHPLLTTDFMAQADIFEARHKDAIDAFHGVKTAENANFFDHFQQTIGGKPKPAVSGSDAHSVARYGVYPVDQHGRERCTWVKAEPTFRGLRQILTEPAARVQVGPEPAKLALVRERPTKYIRSLAIRKRHGSDLSEAWFDIDLRFNHDLVAIIGNKGNGKSALADILGLLGNSRNHKEFSFLNDDKFRNPRLNKAKHFEATLTWESGEVVTRSLDANPGAEEVERVRYLPQNYLETVCNEIRLRQGGGFDAELKSVIFSHVPPAERLGTETLDQLLGRKTRETHDTIAILKSQLHEVNVQIARLERQASAEHRQSLHNQLELKRRELEAHEGTKPAAVSAPAADPTAQAQAEAAYREIDQIREELATTATEIQAAVTEERGLTLALAKLTSIDGQLDNFARVYQELCEKLQQDLPALELAIGDILAVTVRREPLEAKRALLERLIADVKGRLAADQVGSPAAREFSLSRRLESLQAELEGPAKQYQEYLTSLEVWEAEGRRIIGDAQTPDTIAHLEAALKGLEQLPAQLEELREKRKTKAREIFSEIARLAAAYRAVYQPVQDFSRHHPLISERFGLNFSVTISPTSTLLDRFFTLIHRGVAGSFCGMEEGERAFRSLVSRSDFSTEEGALGFAEEVMSHLAEDKRQGNQGTPVTLSKQLRKGQTAEGIYDFIYSFEYLEPQYNLNLGDKELSQLSPGERGMLLLMFYLLIDKEDIPLVVDQPEGNLDNQTVYKLLGECIKEAKRRRQIVIVTHNPNLAVACDAEQIVCALMDPKDGNRIRYLSGAIENPQLNKLLINVLEGTRPAFDNRDAKYFAEA